MKNILLTCAGGYQGLSLIKNIRKIKEPSNVLVIDTFEDNITKYFADFYFISPAVQHENEYLLFIEEIVKKYKVEYIIPATAIDISILSKLKKRFYNKYNCKIVCPDFEWVDIFINKQKANVFLEENNLPHQKLQNPHQSDAYPLFAKAMFSWGAKDCYKLNNIHDFQNHFVLNPLNNLNIDEFIFVEYLEKFEEYSIDFSVSIKGDVSDFQIRKRLKTFSGFAVISEYYDIRNVPIEVSKLLLDIKKIFSHEKFYGLYNIQILVTSDNVYISDINPRGGTSSIVFNNNIKIYENIFENTINDENYSLLVEGKCIRYIEEKWIPKIVISTEIKSIVFDLDNTLIDQNQLVLDRLKLLYENHLKTHVQDFNAYIQYVLYLIEHCKLESLIDLLIEKFSLSISKEELIKVYRKLFPDKINTYPEVFPIISYLKSKKYKLFILTDNPVHSQMEKIKRSNLSNLFDDIFISEMYKTSKKDTNFFNIISQKYNISNENMVMVGDDFTLDILPSLNAGFQYGFYLNKNKKIATALDSIITNNSKIIKISSLSDLKTYL